jgi:hypothetical protein
MAEYAPGVGSFQSLTQKPTSGEPPDGELDGDDAGDHGREGDRGAAVAHQQQHVLNFLRDKFTAETPISGCRRRRLRSIARSTTWLHSARQAERAFNLERGHSNRHFIPEETWDSLDDGLLAGERLEVALHRMEKAYFSDDLAPVYRRSTGITSPRFLRVCP